MGSIYGNNKNTTSKNNRSSNENKQNDVFEEKINDTQKNKKVLLSSVVISVVVVAILIVFSYIALSPDNIREVYTKLVLLPIAAFVGSFISCLINKDFFMNLLGNAAVLFFTYLIFIDLSFMVVLWLIFYAVNAIIGIMTAYIAKTFR